MPYRGSAGANIVGRRSRSCVGRKLLRTFPGRLGRPFTLNVFLVKIVKVGVHQSVLGGDTILGIVFEKLLE